MWLVLSMGKEHHILVSHVNAHQNVTSIEEEFSSQVDRITHFLHSQPLYQPSLSLPNGLINKVAMVAEMGLYMGLKTWTAIHQD